MKPAGVFVALCCACIFAFATAAQERQNSAPHPGLHPVRDARGKWGFIDRTGRFRIRPQYDGAGKFSDGVAYVYKWNGERRINGVVDASGRFTELPTNDYEVTFHDGLARVQQTPSGGERRYGYIDKTGRMVIEPQFYDAGDFSEGLAWFSVLREREWLYGFIDKTGKVVIEPQFVHEPRNFAHGLAKVMGKERVGFIDRTGSYRIVVGYEQADDHFSEGLLAAVLEGEPARGVFLDSEGRVALEIPFWQQRTAWQRSLYSLRRQQLAPFSEGLAPVLSFNRIGFIDRAGKVVIAPEFRETKGFAEGLAAVKIIGHDGQYVWGYIDRAGNFAIEPRFKEAGDFAGGLADVTATDDKRHLINSRGEVVFSF